MMQGGPERAAELRRVVENQNETVSDEQKQELVELLSVDDPTVAERATASLLVLGGAFSADPVLEGASDDLVRIIDSYEGDAANQAGSLLMRAILADVIEPEAVASDAELFFELLGREDDIGEIAEIVLGNLAVERTTVRDRLFELVENGAESERSGALEALRIAALEDSDLLSEVEESFITQLDADDAALQQAAVNGIDALVSEGIDISDETVDSLFELLSADAASLRSAVGTPIGKIVVGDETRRTRLLDALSATDLHVRGAAANAFHQYLFEDDADPTEAELEAAATALAETVEAGDADAWTRTNALDAVEWFVRQYPPIAEPMAPVVIGVFDEDDADPDVITSALDAFSRIRYNHDAAGSRAARPISSLLDHENPEVRAKALSELDSIGIGYPEVVASDIDRVIARLDDDSEDVVENAASVLDRIADDVPDELEAVVPQLRTLMFEGSLDPSGIVSRGEADAAADVLSGLKPTYSDRIEALTRDLFDALDADDETRRIRAAAFLPKFVDFDSADLDPEEWDRLLSGLADTLDNGGPAERKLAAEALQTIFHDVARTVRFAEAYDDEYDDHIEGTTHGVERAIATLVAALDDGAEDVGWHSMDALQSVAEYDASLVREHVDRVAEVVADPADDRQREDALEFLAAIGEDYPSDLLDIVPELEAGLRDDAEHVGDIASILANVADEHPEAVKPAAPALRENLRNPDIDAFDWIELAEALSEIGFEYPEEVTPVADQFVTALTTGLDDGDTESDAESETTLGPQNQLVEALEDFIGSNGPNVELYATKAIATVAMDDAEPAIPAIEPLATILRDGTRYDGLTRSGEEASDRVARHWASFALAAIAYREPEAVVPVADTVSDYLDDDESLIRANTVRTISFVAEHDPETVSEDAKLTTLYLLEDDRPITREYACLALGGMGATMAETELKKLARTDENDDVRRAAEAAIDLLSGGADDAVVDIEQTGTDIGIHMSDPNDEFSL